MECMGRREDTWVEAYWNDWWESPGLSENQIKHPVGVEAEKRREKEMIPPVYHLWGQKKIQVIL